MSFWERKMKTYFARIDTDKDGSITEKDFQKMAINFTEKGKFSAAKGDALKGILSQVWADLGAAGAGGVKVDGFIASMKTAVKDATKMGKLMESLDHFFSAVDDNEDGKIDGSEYKMFFVAMGIDGGLADAAFKAIDTDHDGQLTVSEFKIAGKDFFESEDENSPFKDFWGPLEK